LTAKIDSPVSVAGVGVERGDHGDVADLAAGAQLQRVAADEVAQALLQRGLVLGRRVVATLTHAAP
jgi:hypothetical protein